MVFVALFVVLLLSSGQCLAACRGCLELDDLVFDKMLEKFAVSVVKFDIAFPYGEKHEAFGELAKAMADGDGDILVALVGIKDYGDKDNAELATRFSIDPNDYPAVKLFRDGNTKEWIDFPKGTPFTTSELKKFISENSDIYIGLPGCIRDLHEIAEKFMKAPSNRESVLISAEHFIANYSGDKESANIYALIMKKILEKGESFVQSEEQRVKKLLEGKINEKKRKEMSQRLNILDAFHLHDVDTPKRNEL